MTAPTVPASLDGSGISKRAWWRLGSNLSPRGSIFSMPFCWKICDEGSMQRDPRQGIGGSIAWLWTRKERGLRGLRTCSSTFSVSWTPSSMERSIFLADSASMSSPPLPPKTSSGTALVARSRLSATSRMDFTKPWRRESGAVEGVGGLGAPDVQYTGRAAFPASGKRSYSWMTSMKHQMQGAWKPCLHCKLLRVLGLPGGPLPQVLHVCQGVHELVLGV